MKLPAKRPGRPKDEGLAARRCKEILDVAARLFAARGYQNTDVQVVADELGVGKGTVYRYFPSKRELFLGFLRQTGLRFSEPEGAYYVLLDIAESGWTDDRAFCDWLVTQVGVAAVPGSSFFHEPVRNLIRFHFAKRPETLEAAGERLLGLREKARGAGAGKGQP